MLCVCVLKVEGAWTVPHVCKVMSAAGVKW